MPAGWEPWPTTPAGRGRDAGGGRSEPWGVRAGVWEPLDLPSSGGVQKEPGASSGSAMAPPSAPDLTVADADALDCGVCCLPLKPPIFQFGVGHVVCAPCCDKLTGTGRKCCHVCGVAMGAGGYRRCYAMERVVESVRGPCPNAPYGCHATPAYHGREAHLRVCPHTPCHCPGEACSFAGSTAALQDHVVGAHNWPCLNSTLREFYLRLRDGFIFAASSDGDLLLLNVTRHPFCRAVSITCIRPRGAIATERKLALSYAGHCSIFGNDRSVSHEQRTEFIVPCSDLSDGLPGSNDCHQLLVPNYVLGDDMEVRVLLRFLRDYTSDPVIDSGDSYSDYSRRYVQGNAFTGQGKHSMMSSMSKPSH